VSKFFYARLVTPQKIQLGSTASDTPIFLDCAQCGKVNAVIHGQIKDSVNHQVACIPSDNGITIKSASFCQSCFDEMVS